MLSGHDLFDPGVLRNDRYLWDALYADLDICWEIIGALFVLL